MKNKTKLTLSAIASVVIIAGISSYAAFGCSKKYDDTKTFTVGDGSTLKVGILSDTQLPANGEDGSTQLDALKKALEYLKESSVDAIILDGDFTDLGTKEAWQSFSDTYDEVFGDEKPLQIFAMGNHDYWLAMFKNSHEIATPAKMQRRFTQYTGEYPYAHKIINGYHFIAWSSSNGSYDMSYSSDKWIRAELDAAVADAPDKPVFVITHLNPQDTVYGSDDWGNKDIYNVLKDYPQVISFSGHSHYAIADERSIWQGEFTAVNTQTTDYIELESGKYNGTVPRDAYGNEACHYPVCMIMDVSPENVTLNRVSLDSGKTIKEPWVISAPFADRSSFIYTNKLRIEADAAPCFTTDGNVEICREKDIEGNVISVIKFDAASDDDFVHSYRLEFLDGDSQILSFDETNYDGSAKAAAKKIEFIEYFSDFTLGIDNMSARAALRLPPNIPEGTAFIRITAIDTWGRESQGIQYRIDI